MKAGLWTRSQRDKREKMQTRCMFYDVSRSENDDNKKTVQAIILLLLPCSGHKTREIG